jgi:uncharacterized protein YqeY
MAHSETAARLKSDVVVAMKAKDKDRLKVLRMLQAALKQVEVDERRELTEDDVTRALAAYQKKVKDQVRSYGEGGRAELLAEAEAELAIVQEYLPQGLDAAAIEAIVREAIAETGASGPADMGKVMKAVMPRTAGRADGAEVSATVKRILAG